MRILKQSLVVFTLLCIIGTVGYASPVKSTYTTDNTQKIALTTVNVKNFVRAETDEIMKSYIKEGAGGKLLHIRLPVPIEKQHVIRTNRDVIFSVGVFDLTTPVTLTKPKLDNRFQSMLAISQDHFTQPVVHDGGEIVLTKEKVGTRYVIVLFRTFIDSNNPDDAILANNAQDLLTVSQKDVGSFDFPNWDTKGIKETQIIINSLASNVKDKNNFYGEQGKINALDHVLGAAFGWGGNPKEAAMYESVTPSKNDGKTQYSITVKDVPVHSFWSVTVYNKDGFVEKNEAGIYTYNNVTAQKNKDGSVTINFGGDKDSINNLAIMDGWNYLVRFYQPKQEVIDGLYHFPASTIVK